MRPGFGKSERNPQNYSIHAQANAILRTLTLNNITRFHLVGWSMGGGVALNIINLLGPTANARVASLTLMASLNLQGRSFRLLEHYSTPSA